MEAVLRGLALGSTVVAAIAIAFLILNVIAGFAPRSYFAYRVYIGSRRLLEMVANLDFPDPRTQRTRPGLAFPIAGIRYPAVIPVPRIVQPEAMEPAEYLDDEEVGS